MENKIKIKTSLWRKTSFCKGFTNNQEEGINIGWKKQINWKIWIR